MLDFNQLKTIVIGVVSAMVAQISRTETVSMSGSGRRGRNIYIHISRWFLVLISSVQKEPTGMQSKS